VYLNPGKVHLLEDFGGVVPPDLGPGPTGRRVDDGPEKRTEAGVLDRGPQIEERHSACIMDNGQGLGHGTWPGRLLRISVTLFPLHHCLI
jgi:hypothetical protein